MNIVVINEQHSLLEEQRKILEEKFGDYSICKVPAKGWTLKEMEEKYSQLWGYDNIIFVSPVPVLLAKLSVHRDPICAGGHYPHIWVFNNSHREKVELPNGKVIYKIPQTGWDLVFID